MGRRRKNTDDDGDGDDVEQYGVDVEKAKKYLKAANVENPKLTLAYPNMAPNETVATIIQDNLKAVGIELELVNMEANAFYSSLNNKDGNFDLYLSGYIMTIDPDGYAPLFKSDGAINFASYNNPKVDELFDQGINEFDSAKREEIYKQAQQVVQDDAVFLPLTENMRVIAVSNDVVINEDEFVSIYAIDDWANISFKK